MRRMSEKERNDCKITQKQEKQLHVLEKSVHRMGGKFYKAKEIIQKSHIKILEMKNSVSNTYYRDSMSSIFHNADIRICKPECKS